jgi:hypothetical protein
VSSILPREGRKNKNNDLTLSGSSGWQRVALLQVWKSFEEQRGTADDIAKVEGMMPVQGKRRYVDEETGQLVEGMHIVPFLSRLEGRTRLI